VFAGVGSCLAAVNASRFGGNTARDAGLASNGTEGVPMGGGGAFMVLSPGVSDGREFGLCTVHCPTSSIDCMETRPVVGGSTFDRWPWAAQQRIAAAVASSSVRSPWAAGRAHCSTPARACPKPDCRHPPDLQCKVALASAVFANNSASGDGGAAHFRLAEVCKNVAAWPPTWIVHMLRSRLELPNVGQGVIKPHFQTDGMI